MNYFIDLLPSSNLINQTNDLFDKDDNIIFNIYVKQLPAMNIYKELYYDLENAFKIVKELKSQNKKVNLVFDTFCFGNKEFTKKGKEKFEILDSFLKLKIDFVTITNNFFFNYIKRRHKECKIIISEYSDITNIQKIDRFLNDMKADGVKLDLKLTKNTEQMKNIKECFDIDSIYINVNKKAFEDDIFKDSINNSLSHYIEDENWEKVKETMTIYEKDNKNNNILLLSNEEYKKLKEIGFVNFFYSYNGEEEKYLDKIKYDLV